MNKSLIALAIAALSSNAFATDFTASSVVPVKYASEITLPADLNDTAANDLDATFQLDFSATAGVKRYVRFDLTNAKFKNVVAASDLATTTALNGSVSKGGSSGSDFVVIEITPTGTLPNTSKLKLDLAEITATGGDIGIKYRLYETGVAAAAGNGDTLASASGTLVSFTPALTVKPIANKSIIDVNQLSTYFLGGLPKRDSVTVGSVAVAVDNNVLTAAGTPAVIGNLVASAKLEVSGDFSAGKKTDSRPFLFSVSKLYK